MIYIEHFLAAWFERRREQSGDAGVNANGDITSMYPYAAALPLPSKQGACKVKYLSVLGMGAQNTG